MNDLKLIVIDDHPVVLEGLHSVLTAEGYTVLKAGSVEEAESIVSADGDIGLLVVDLSIHKDADGLDLIRRLRAGGCSAPALVYTMHEEMWNIATLIDADVEGVVLKGERIDELIEAVRIVGKGAIYRSPEFCDRFDSVRKSRGILSKTDIEVLRLVSKGMGNSEISGKINLSEKSVEYHRSNIIKKLGCKNMTEAIGNAVKLGIITCLVAFVPSMAKAVENAPAAVDLGLSVKWADRNLGADSPLESGSFFSFGETEPKENYDWITYTHCDALGDYMDMFRQKEIGDESICSTDLDAAHVLLGGGWRMPTEEEMAELIEACEIQYVEADPHKYMRFEAANGNYIDFPFSGYMLKETLRASNQEGEVWSGSFYVDAGDEDDFVYYMNSPTGMGYDKKNGVHLIEISPQLGLPIRPVLDEGTGVSAVDVSVSSSDAIYTIDGRRVVSATSPGLYIVGGRKILVH